MSAPTETGTYRVLDARGEDELLLADLDSEDFSTISVRRTEHDGDLATIVEGLRPGYKVDATLEWLPDGMLTFQEVSVIHHTLIEYVNGASPMFEVALGTWEEAQHEGRGVNSTVTFSNDQEPNGALYTFADDPGPGANSIFEEFKTGDRPIEPLLEQIEPDEPYEAFVLRPAAHDFVAVYIVLSKGSILAETVRDTYECQRPPEPLVEVSET